MTNEAKAREIANLHKIVYKHGLENERGTSFIECASSAYQMAQWKDAQFKEYLEKNRTNYPDFMYGTDTYAFGMKEGYVKAFDKIINELFKEE